MKYHLIIKIMKPLICIFFLNMMPIEPASCWTSLYVLRPFVSLINRKSITCFKLFMHQNNSTNHIYEKNKLFILNLMSSLKSNITLNNWTNYRLYINHFINNFSFLTNAQNHTKLWKLEQITNWLYITSSASGSWHTTI